MTVASSSQRSGPGLRRSKRRVDGVLLLDKPVGPSSNQVLQWVKRHYQAEKAGHTGTLDPFASGLLPVMFGEATKFSGFLLDAAKEYEAQIRLGVVTSTGDITGEIVERNAASVSDQEMRSVVASFSGEQWQTPPMHSALKRNGVPLYELARKGETVAREPRRVVIHAIDVLGFDGTHCDVRVSCSKGTYIRVLAEDIGRRLGCGATLSALRRTRVANFDESRSCSVSMLEPLSIDSLDSKLLPMDTGLDHLRRISLDASQKQRIRLGQALQLNLERSDVPVVARLYCADSEEFLGLGTWVAGTLHPLRLVVASPAKTA